MDTVAYLKEVFRDNKILFRALRLVLRTWRAKTDGYPDWKAILRGDRAAWTRALASSYSGPHVLMATSDGGNLHAATLESLLAAALTLRGAHVHVLLCDNALPACWECDATLYPDIGHFLRHGPSKDICKTCFRPAARMFQAMGLTLHRYSEFLTGEETARARSLAQSLSRDEMAAYKLDGLAVGEHALAGALRFFAKGELDSEPDSLGVLRRYFEAALLTTFATRTLLKRFPFVSATCTHGIYVPFGLIGEAAREAGVRVVNWNVAYRKKCFVFSHHDTYHHTLMAEPTSKWENLEWTRETEARTVAYLRSRAEGTQDWIWFHDKPVSDQDAIRNQLGLDPKKPVIGMLTNVIWDAQLHYPANAFPNMVDWAVRTIEWFAKRQDLQLVVRIHPAEIRGFLKSRQLMADEIAKRFPVLPPNVFVIRPDNQISTYAVMALCNSVIIFGTKTGVELTSMGIPVIVAGEAWIRNKGVTLDAASAEDYFRILEKLPLPARLDAATIRRARMYAYHFFFRRMVPIETLEVFKGNPPFRISLAGLDALLPGRSTGMDVICDGILKGTDFIYPDESFPAAEREPTPPPLAR